MIVIVDYGAGNIGAIFKMLRKIGAKVRVGSERQDMEIADKLILPGVGHFGHGMRKLSESGLLPIVEEQALAARKPFLGICLGMQMMTRGSDESDAPGLGWVEAQTVRFPDRPGLRIPHMGWNTVQPAAKARIFDPQPTEPERFYFTHSYHVRTDDAAHSIASCHNGIDFTAGFEVGNLFGVQFHPEKSHSFGMKLLSRFAAL